VTLYNQYLTLASYLIGNSAGAPLTQFRPNNVYTLNDIQFSFASLSDTPELQAVNVLVDIDMLAWADNTIVWNN
jgi:hypothetical protein